MIAPFFGVGHLLALIAGAPRDGFSWPYQGAAAAAGFVYVLIGLVILASVLRRWFGRGTVLLTLMATTSGRTCFTTQRTTRCSATRSRSRWSPSS